MEVEHLNILQAIGMIAGVCAAAFVVVLAKIAIKESQRVKQSPIQLEISSSAGDTPEEHGYKEGIAYHPSTI